MTEEFKEGKYLVVRRDGTVPLWPHFVLSARDPAAPEALRQYALRCERVGYKKDYVDSVWLLSRQFEDYHKANGTGDPDAAPHRQDNAFVISMMRHEMDLTGLGQAPRMREDIEYIAALNKIVRTAAACPEIHTVAGDTVRKVLEIAQDVLRAHPNAGADDQPASGSAV